MFDNFRTTQGLSCSWPTETQHVVQFVAHMSLAGKAYGTVRTYLAGIAAKHKLNGWGDPTQNYLIQKVMQGFAKTNNHSDSRLPITMGHLQKLIPTLPGVCTSTYESKLFKAAYTLAFFGFFRVSELLGQGIDGKGGRKGLSFSDIHLGQNLRVNLSGSKTDQANIGQSVLVRCVPCNLEICPVKAMRDYVQARGSADGDLFVHFGGRPLTRNQFQAVLKKGAGVLGWDIALYSSHSFRIGAATTAAANGWPLQVIMTQGRWRSSVAQKYVRI